MKSPITRAAIAISALVAIAILANWLVALTPYGNRGADFTENKIHTLTKGTKAIVGDLKFDVVIRYYATRTSDYMPEELKVHMRRVDDLLKEYENLSKGKLRIENLDPLPDTDAEDSANLDEISGQRINNDNLYIGLTISALDKKVVIPFLDPREETMLEYQISKAIAEVTTLEKPVIGIISALNLAGTPAMMPGQQDQPGWVIYEQLRQSFKLEDLGMDPQSIDPEKIKTILLIHPAGISKQTEFVIDQYLLNGGTVVACLDPHSIAAQMTSGGNPMMGQSGAPTSSTLPTLLPSWGIEFDSTRVLADPKYSTTLEGNRKAIVVLNLPKSAMPQEDSIITQTLESVMLYLPGGFKRNGGGMTSSSLIRSSTLAGFVDPMLAARLDPSIETSLESEKTAFDLVTHLSGEFKTAFPDGKPKPPVDPANPENPEQPEETSNQEFIKTAKKTGNVFLIADVDAFYDPFAYNVQNFGGMKMANPSNGNSSLLFNVLDQAVGSTHLIGSRSRSATRRPFTVIQEMENDFDRERGTKVKEIEAKEKITLERLQELQALRADSNSPFLSPQQEEEYKNLNKEKTQYAREIREQEKDLQRKKDRLTGDVILYNVAGMPAFIILFSIGLYFVRRSSTRAR
jgi:ABC-type uncharacterized transport system involved in gliding motility auxiliary subunit